LFSAHAIRAARKSIAQLTHLISTSIKKAKEFILVDRSCGKGVKNLLITLMWKSCEHLPIYSETNKQQVYMKLSFFSKRTSLALSLCSFFAAGILLTSCHTSHLCPAYPYKSKKGVENIAKVPSEKQSNG
jgi:hypothetical protein